ncbi:MAG TPA: hypothetical protein P5262_04090 [Candidatus Moranbacteria bacterium]|nr:hypothetical protein [Candidatus Moranbacteria bacterium]
MFTVGRCPYCKNPGKKRNEHHIIPKRFTKGKKNEEDDEWWTRRLNVLFPEHFRRGINEKVEHICLECHRKVDALIPQESMLLPDKYFLFNKMLKNGTSIDDAETIRSTLNTWIHESSDEIERRREHLLFKKEFAIATANLVRICLARILFV